MLVRCIIGMCANYRYDVLSLNVISCKLQLINNNSEHSLIGLLDEILY